MNSSSGPLLKNKLGHIKLLLDDANYRLRDEADIFTTKASASVAPEPNQNGHTRRLPPAELRRTIADISTIQSVLSCPIFNQIANVTDSLDKLTYYLNLRPSIGPGDIDFNDSGELVLAPPVEPTSLNNFINSQLDEYSNVPNSSPQQPETQQNLTNSTVLATAQSSLASTTTTLLAQSGDNGNNLEHQLNSEHQQQNASNYYTEYAKHQAKDDGMINSPVGGKLHEPSASKQDYTNQQKSTNIPAAVAPVQYRRNGYDSEKLLGAEANQTNSYANGTRRLTKVQSVAAVFESAISANEANHRGLYKANAQIALNQPNSSDIRMDFETTLSMSQINGQSTNGESAQQTPSYATNDMYKTAHELVGAGNIGPETFQHKEMTKPIPDVYQHQIGAQVASGKVQNGKIVMNQRESLATNVRLTDECDSGTSSFRSKGALYSPQSQKPIEQFDDSSIDQELIDKLSPEMERIKVTLEKDSSGLGITIAGYTCEDEEISGIFIKSITPGSPADRSGKIRILDQIFAVNGQEILGYSNPDAVNVLRRQTSRVVTLDLMRYLAESKYKKLQTMLERAAPSSNLQGSSARKSFTSDDAQATKAQSVLGKSSPLKRAEPLPVESMYNNSSAFIRPQKLPDGATSPIPVAAQRTTPTTSKVIETKQGAINKIDIRPPQNVAQTGSMATYMNEMAPAYHAPPSSAILGQELAADNFSQLEKLEWADTVQIVDLRRESTQSLGFKIKEYAKPKDPQQSIFMIISITPGSIADHSGQLSIGDLLVFVDDTQLANSSWDEAVRALKRTSGDVRLGILKYLRN